MTPIGEPTPASTASADALFDAVYGRLKAMAGRQLANADRGTLDTTALVHELYLRCKTHGELSFSHPAKFYAYAARAIRHLLCDHARDRMRQCAGGDWQRLTLTGAEQHLVIESAEQAIAFDDVLAALEKEDARAAQVVELRYFGGLSLEEVAETMNVNRSTVDRDWRFARAYLHKALG